jgi:hypothetical protein
MADEDLEYLVRTLSEARSRATEITVSVRARVGVEHLLGELGDLAVSKIEMLLDELREFAVSDSATSTGSTEPPSTGHAQVVPPGAHAGPPSTECFSSGGDQADHWLHAFIGDITANFRASGGITFETARRMYRIYPQLFEAAPSCDLSETLIEQRFEPKAGIIPG